MKKKLLKVVGVLVLLVVVAVAVALFFIDSLARRAVEKGATWALGVPTTLGSADVGLLGGQFTMGRLAVANPPGFEQERFLGLDRGHVAVSLGTLRSQLVELPTLELSDIDVNLEKRQGKANYQVILDNLKRFEKSGPPQEAKEGRQFVISEVLVRDVTVGVDLLPVGGQLTHLDVPIEEIRLQNVGSQSDRGVLISELSGILLKAILLAVIDKAGNELPAEVLQGLGTSLQELTSLADLGIDASVLAGDGLLDLTDGVLGEVGQPVTDLIRGAGGELEKAGRDVTKSIEEGLGGLLGGKKEDDGDG